MIDYLKKLGSNDSASEAVDNEDYNAPGVNKAILFSWSFQDTFIPWYSNQPVISPCCTLFFLSFLKDHLVCPMVTHWRHTKREQHPSIQQHTENLIICSSYPMWDNMIQFPAVLRQMVHGRSWNRQIRFKAPSVWGATCCTATVAGVTSKDIPYIN